MPDNENKNLSLVPLGSNILQKVSLSLYYTNKILEERAEYFFNLGFVFHNSADIKEVFENFSKAIQNSPNYLNEHNYSCKALNEGDYQKAIENYSIAIDYFPNYKIAFYFRGLALWHFKNKWPDLSSAAEDFTKVIELDDQYALSYFWRGNTQYYRMHYKEAIKDYNIAIQLDPNNTEAYENRADCKQLFSIYGMDDWEKANEYNMRNFLKYDERGNLRIPDNFTGDTNDKLKIEKFRESLPRYDDVDPQIRILYLREAIEDYKRAIKLSPNDPVLYNHQGNAKFRLRDYFSAIEAYNKAIELYPKFHIAYENRAIAKQTISDFNGSRFDADLAKTFAPPKDPSPYKKGSLMDLVYNRKVNYIELSWYEINDSQ